MARLIDANLVIDRLKTNIILGATEQAFLRNYVNCCPTVDAVEVLRCRDCTYWGDEDGKLQGSDGVLFARCKAHNYLIDGRHTGWCPSENDFCSYGERNGGDADA